MDSWIDGFLDGFLDGWVDGLMDPWVDRRTFRQVDMDSWVNRLIIILRDT